MRLAAEKELAHIGESQGAADHDHDMIHELSKRLDALWRYDQYIANADGQIDLQNFWQNVKTQEQENEVAIPAGFEPATHGVEIRHSADHRLTTETPRTNGDKVRSSSTNFIVFVEFFDCYLRSGRRVRRVASERGIARFDVLPAIYNLRVTY